MEAMQALGERIILASFWGSGLKYHQDLGHRVRVKAREDFVHSHSDWGDGAAISATVEFISFYNSCFNGKITNCALGQSLRKEDKLTKCCHGLNEKLSAKGAPIR